jgi:hypothetical protein
MKDPIISVFGRQADDGSRTRALTRLSDYLYAQGEVKASTLRSRIAEFLESMKLVMQNIPADFGELHLDSITIAVEVNTKGQVSLLGAAGEIGGKGGISFTLKRISDHAATNSPALGGRPPASQPGKACDSKGLTCSANENQDE